MNDQELLKRITVNPEIFGGKTSIAATKSALRHAGTVTISRAPRSESSGSVQPILSTMLPHDG